MKQQSYEELQADMRYLNDELHKLSLFTVSVLQKNLDGPHVRFSRIIETLDKINNLQLFIGYEFIPDEQDATRVE